MSSSKPTEGELAEILDKHSKWLREEEGGERANLSSADLRFANLRSADLRSADLSFANLRSADLSFADLRSANLSFANLSFADLSFANLRFADLRSADLSFANLRFANLSSANLRSADLSSANLSSADLSSANLSFANLRSADLSWANLRSAKLKDVIGLDFDSLQTLPQEGSFIAYKKVYQGTKPAILTLKIPTSAKRTSSIVGRKCRASKVKVLKAETMDGEPIESGEFYSGHDTEFIYRIGETVKADSYDDSMLVECTHGIHFFHTKKEARGW